MPTRTHVPFFQPPRVVDRVLTHSGEVVAAGWAVVVGLMLVVNALAPEFFSASRIIEDIRPELRGWCGGSLVAGGLVSLWAVLRRWPVTEAVISWRIELAALLTACSGWVLLLTEALPDVWRAPILVGSMVPPALVCAMRTITVARALALVTRAAAAIKRTSRREEARQEGDSE